MLQPRPKALECGASAPLFGPGPAHQPKAAKHRPIPECAASAPPRFISPAATLCQSGDASPHSKARGAQRPWRTRWLWSCEGLIVRSCERTTTEDSLLDQSASSRSKVSKKSSGDLRREFVAGRCVFTNLTFRQPSIQSTLSSNKELNLMLRNNLRLCSRRPTISAALLRRFEMLRRAIGISRG